MSPEEREMISQLNELQKQATEIMFVLRGSKETGTTGIVQDLQGVEGALAGIVREMAHLFRFKKRVEEASIDRERREAENLKRELENQRLRRDSRQKTWGIIITISLAVGKMLFDYFAK